VSEGQLEWVLSEQQLIVKIWLSPTCSYYLYVIRVLCQVCQAKVLFAKFKEEQSKRRKNIKKEIKATLHGPDGGCNLITGT
jgi:hypothetical protein